MHIYIPVHVYSICKYGSLVQVSSTYTQHAEIAYSELFWIFLRIACMLLCILQGVR